MKKKVIVIGTGFGGLASAALLAKEGFEVEVFEKNDQIGGRATVYKEKGFTFDMGPSWYLLPDVFEKFFKQFGKEIKDLYKLEKLDPSYRVFFGPNESVDIFSDVDKNKDFFESNELGSFEKFKKFLELSKQKYEIAINNFVYKNYYNIFSFLNPELLMKGKNLDALTTLENYVNKFFKSEKIKKVVMYSVLFLGGIPKQTSALFSMMTHVDFNMGVWYPQGGISMVTNAIYDIAKNLGVKFNFNSGVEKIVVENGIAKAIVVNGNQINSDIIVSNADYAFTELNLIEEKYQSYKKSYWEKRKLAPSAFVLYIGLNKQIQKLKHHSIFFAENWDHFNKDIAENPKWPNKPSFYLCTPSKTDITVAPRGKENIFITVPISTELEDSETIREEYKTKILKIVEDYLGEEIIKDIEVIKVHTINDYKEMYNAYNGTALGLAPTLLQSVAFRPSNRSKKIKNLYYTGQYVSPGAGMSMCIISAELATERILKEQI